MAIKHLALSVPDDGKSRKALRTHEIHNVLLKFFGIFFQCLPYFRLISFVSILTLV